jgi:hypothetical protein
LGEKAILVVSLNQIQEMKMAALNHAAIFAMSNCEDSCG